MLNPDGVIVGNYRCSLAGRDLNRNYRTKLKDAYPTVWHTKAMVKRSESKLTREGFLDLCTVNSVHQLIKIFPQKFWIKVCQILLLVANLY